MSVTSLVASLAACGALADDPDRGGDDVAVYPWEATASVARHALPRSCSDDWTPLLETEASIIADLVVHGTELIFGVGPSLDAPREVRALDLSGSGRERVLHVGSTYDNLWLEGDDLLLWTGEVLRRLPLAGGSEEVLLDLRDGGSPPRVGDLLVRPDALYWTLAVDDSPPLELWRQARSGGPRERIASLAEGPLVPALAVTRELVIVAGSLNALALSLPSGPARALDVVAQGSFAGIDELGAYHEREANRTRQGGRALEFEIRRAPADGSASTLLWRGAAGERLDRLWPAESGWLATGAWYMFDRRPHAVIAHIDGTGEATPIACDRGDDVLVGRPVYSDGSFYAVSSADNRSRIVQIRLSRE